MELLKELGIEPGVLLISIIGFLVLLWFFRRYAFGPVGQYMEQRTVEIERMIAEARATHEQAQAERAALQQELEAERVRARDEIGRMTQEAKRAIEQLNHDARVQRQEMVAQGQAEIERTKDSALAELQHHVSDMALEISSQILRQTLTDERQSALVDSFVADVEKAAANRGPR